MKLSDVAVNPGSGFISLAKLSGSGIADITGYLSKEFGQVTFVISRIVLANGNKLFVGGEHDMPYIEDTIVPDTMLEQLYEESKNV